MTDMRVCVFPADDSGCGHYRAIFPANALIEQGADVRITKKFGDAYWRGDVPVRFARDPDYDVAVIQRPFSQAATLTIRLLQQYGIAVVVDVDDDMAHLPPGHPAFAEVHPKLYKADPLQNNWHNLEVACLMADLVTVSTPSLVQSFGGPEHCTVLRNCVPGRNFHTDHPERSDVPVVGWTGTSQVHPGDLEVCRNSVAEAVRITRTSFRCWGDAAPAQRLALRDDEYDVRPWVDDLLDFPAEVAQLDVGIAPLALNRFNEGKSALRGLEYASVGVPFVASGTGEYRRLAKLGAGLIAEKPRAWRNALVSMLGSREHRAHLAGEALNAVQGMTYAANCHRWWEAWESALARVRATHASA